MLRTRSTVAALSLLLSFGTAEATILTFDQDAPDDPVNNGSLVPQAYGDNVAGSPQGGFTYGNGGEGYTPDVVVDYGPVPTDVAMWATDYGDLTNVIYREPETGGVLDVVLTAGSGFQVLLYSFDLGGWPDTDYVIDAVNVFDGGGVSLFECLDCAIEGTNGHSAFVFPTPLQAEILRIHFDTTSLGAAGDNIGLDNVRFGQEGPAAVPEPATLLLLGSGLAGVGAIRRRRPGGRPAGAIRP